MGSFYSSNRSVDMEQKDIHNDDDDFFEVKKTTIFPIDDFIISKNIPKILPTIYEEKEKDKVEHDVHIMEQYQKNKLDDVFGI